MKKEKGSVTLFILIAGMFMIIILLMVNIGVMNKNKSQEKELEEIAKQYSQNETDLDNIYTGVADASIEALTSQIINIIYPVGSIYITTNEQNPSEYIGGEWESYGEGRTIVGAGTGTDENNIKKVFEINQTGGEYSNTLTKNEMPNHNHGSVSLVGSFENRCYGPNGDIDVVGIGAMNGVTGIVSVSSATWSGSHGSMTSYGNISNPKFTRININATHTHASEGNGQPHNNVQPYIVTYIWKRVE